MKFFYLCLFLFLPFFSARAEYRVFLLQITSPDGLSVKEFPSNLDPDQYIAFFPLAPGEKIGYMKTWMCWGRTNGQAFCRNPKDVALENAQAPAEATPGEAPAPPAEGEKIPNSSP